MSKQNSEVFNIKNKEIESYINEIMKKNQEISDIMKQLEQLKNGNDQASHRHENSEEEIKCLKNKL